MPKTFHARFLISVKSSIVGWFSNRTGTSVDNGARKSNNCWPMAERQIRHRKSCLVLSARFRVANWCSRPVAKKLRRRRQGERHKSNRFNEQNNNSERASRFFVHFFAVPAKLRRLLENRNGKVINSTISVWTRARFPPFISNQNSLLLSNKANWDNREKVLKGCEIYFSSTSWTSPLSDRS